MEICAPGSEVAGARVNEPVIFMNDTTEVGEKMLRPHERLPINLPEERSVNGPLLPETFSLQLITIPV